MSHMGAITFRNASIVRRKILKSGQEGKGKPLAVICDHRGIFCKYLLPLFFPKKNPHYLLLSRFFHIWIPSVWKCSHPLQRPKPACTPWQHLPGCGKVGCADEQAPSTCLAGLVTQNKASVEWRASSWKAKDLPFLRPGLKSQLHCFKCVSLSKVDFPSSSAVRQDCILQDCYEDETHKFDSNM